MNSKVQSGVGAATLEELIEAAGSPVTMLRSATIGPYAFPVLPPAFTNWMEEQRAWNEGCALLELSYHMGELRLTGPDVIPLLSKLAVNKLDPFPSFRAKQIVTCNYDGQMLGEAICFHEEEGSYRLVGTAPCLDWVQFNVETGNYDIDMKREQSAQFNPGGPRLYMFQVQGPLALDLMRAVTDNNLPDIKFFHIGQFRIKGRPVRALRHGMAGVPGFEVYGPWEDQQVIREAFEQAGVAFQMKKVGGLAYPTAATESGWMGLPLPAIYEGEAMKPFREWLTARSFPAIASLGGSYYSDNIADYYTDPYELGYGSHVDANHDFIGRDALLKRGEKQRRKKVTLVWNSDDVLAVMGASLFRSEGAPGKYISLPFTAHAIYQCDSVLKNGELVGISQNSSYSSNANAILSLAIVDTELSEPGTEVTLLWGDVHTKRPVIEKHEIREIRATVAQVPYFEKKIKTF